MCAATGSARTPEQVHLHPLKVKCGASWNTHVHDARSCLYSVSHYPILIGYLIFLSLSLSLGQAYRAVGSLAHSSEFWACEQVCRHEAEIGK